MMENSYVFVYFLHQIIYLLFNKDEVVRSLNELIFRNSLLLVSSADNLCKQFGQDVGPDLDPNCLTMMVFLKEFFEKVAFEKISRRQKACKIIQGGKELRMKGIKS